MIKKTLSETKRSLRASPSVVVAHAQGIPQRLRASECENAMARLNFHMRVDSSDSTGQVIGAIKNGRALGARRERCVGEPGCVEINLNHRLRPLAAPGGGMRAPSVFVFLLFALRAEGIFGLAECTRRGRRQKKRGGRRFWPQACVMPVNHAPCYLATSEYIKFAKFSSSPESR